jgi:hypothetical protein
MRYSWRYPNTPQKLQHIRCPGRLQEAKTLDQIDFLGVAQVTWRDPVSFMRWLAHSVESGWKNLK